MLNHVIMCWWDDAVEGVVECIKALKATEKVGKVGVEMRGATLQSSAQCVVKSVKLKSSACSAPCIYKAVCFERGVRLESSAFRGGGR